MKHGHRPNATLRDVLWITGDHYARQTRHRGMLQEKLMIVNNNWCMSPDIQTRHLTPSFKHPNTDLFMMHNQI